MFRVRGKPKKSVIFLFRPSLINGLSVKSSRLLFIVFVFIVFLVTSVRTLIVMGRIVLLLNMGLLVLIHGRRLILSVFLRWHRGSRRLTKLIIRLNLGVPGVGFTFTLGHILPFLFLDR